MLLITGQPLPPPIPLVLDLDGTLIHTDTFHEMMAYLLIHNPLILLRLPFWFLKGRVYAKAQLVEHTHIKPEDLPFNFSLLSFAEKEAKKGRPLILATGTHQKLAQKISNHLGIFGEVIGSEGGVNMTGPQKQRALLSRFGLHGFDYAGDSRVDTFVWQVSHKILVVCPKWGVLKKASTLKDTKDIHYIPREKTRITAFFLALRPLFWSFNLLTASLNLIIGLSLLSSALLIMGDLLSLEIERRSLFKRSVFAKGYLHLITAFTLAPLLFLISLLFMSSVPKGFLCLGIYIPLFVGLDKFTRCSPLFLRWSLLSLFQIFTALIMGITLAGFVVPPLQ